MKKIKSLISILIVTALILSFSGCTVNQEKLDSQVVATVGDKSVLKKDVDSITTVNLIYYYATYGQQIKPTDDSADEIREDVTNELVNNKLIEYAAKEYGYRLNQKKVKQTADSAMRTIKSSAYIRKDGLKRVLSDYGIKDEKTLRQSINLYAKNSVYESDFQNVFLAKIRGKKYSTNTYMKVGETKLPASYYYYCLIQKTMEQTYEDYQKQYMQQEGQEEEEESSDEKNEKIKKNAEEMIKEKASFYQAGKEDKVSATAKEISAKKSQNASLDAMFGGSSMADVYKTYGMTSAQYQKAAQWVATADVYKDKLDKKVEYTKATESEAQSEFNKNKKTYDQSTVSAKHILTSDKKLAREILSAAKEKDANFDEVMARYQSDQRVSEATDLGAFTYATMEEAFSKAAFGANKGDIVGPVETGYGYHIIYVYDKKEVETKFESYKSSIISSLNNEKRQKAAEKLDEEIKKKYSMTVLISDIDQPYDMLLEKLKKDHPVKIRKSVMNKVNKDIQ